MTTDLKLDAAKLQLPENQDKVVSKTIGPNEGDDQAHIILIPDTPEWTTLSPIGAMKKYCALLSKYTGFRFVPAIMAHDDDMRGRSAVFEMCSCYIGFPHGNSPMWEVVVIVPKVLKSLRKVPRSSVSILHEQILDEHKHVVDVKKDEVYWALCATRSYAIAILNFESLGVRGVHLRHADRAFDHLVRLVGEQKAFEYACKYGDRDPERRALEEYADTTYTHLGVMRQETHEKIQNVNLWRVVRVCVAAWQADLPALANEKREDIGAALFRFDEITLATEIVDEFVEDPLLYWEQLDIGLLLKPLVAYATMNHNKVAALYSNVMVSADPEQTVAIARQLAKPGRKEAPAEKGSDTKDTAKGQKGNTKKVKGGKDKGKGTPDFVTDSAGYTTHFTAPAKGVGKSGKNDRKTYPAQNTRAAKGRGKAFEPAVRHW
jgi:hypothetical protein